MEHLVKLKKDGKCVGYEKRSKYRSIVDNNLCIFSSFDGINWFENELSKEYNSVHPFVCEDKDGNKNSA